MESLKLKGNEVVNINIDIEKIKKSDNKEIEINILDEITKKILIGLSGILRIDTAKEFDYIEKGNILNYVLEELSS